MPGKREVGELFFRMSADVAELRTSMERATKTLSRFDADARRVGAGLKSLFAGIAVGIAGAFGVNELVSGFRAFLDLGDELSKQSQKIGIGVEALQGLRQAAELSDVSSEQLQKGLVKLGGLLQEAIADPASDAAKNFKRLGIDIASVQKASDPLLELWRRLSERFAQADDGFQKTGASSVLFGKRIGADLIPLLNIGIKGLDDAAAEVRVFGRALDTDTARSAEAFNDNMKRVSDIAIGLRNIIGRDLLNAIGPVLERFVTWAKEGDNLSKILEQVRTSAAAVGNAAIEGAKGVAELFRWLEAIATLKVDKIFSGIGDLFRNAFKFDGGLLGFANEQLKALEETRKKFLGQNAKINLPGGVLTEDAEKFWQGVADAVHDTAGSFGDLSKQLAGAYEQAAKLGEEYQAFGPPVAPGAGKRRGGLPSLLGGDKGDGKGKKEKDESFPWKDSGLKKFLDQMDLQTTRTNLELDRLEKKNKELAKDYDVLGEVGSAAFASIGDAIIQLTQDGKAKFSELATSILRDITRVALNSAFRQLFDLAGSAFGKAGGFSGILSSLGGLFRQAGGPVYGGQPYIVGERGPELFVPGAYGQIIPNGAFGLGGANVVINNQGPPLVVRSVEQRRGDIEIAVASAVSAVRADFADSMRTGYGSYSRSMADNLNVRRR